MAVFERRTGIAVCRVVAPPHGLCSELTASHLVRLGFEGLLLYGPGACFVLETDRGMSVLPHESSLAGWLPTDIAADGLPVLPRFALSPWPDDLPLRAFLGQPLIVSGHHGDLAPGVDVLARAAEQINSLDGVRWMSPTDIARSSFSTYRDGHTLRVRMLSRRIRVDVPPGISEVVIETPGLLSASTPQLAVSGRSFPPLLADSSVAVSEPIGVSGAGPIEIGLVCADGADPARIATPGRSATPYLRRLATEARDRMAPRIPPRYRSTRRDRAA
jgi:hypothetical protein